MPSAHQQETGWVETLKVVAVIVGVVGGLFTVLKNVTAEPLITLSVAIAGGVFISAYLFAKKYAVLNIVVGWLSLLVIGLVFYVAFPRTFAIIGTIYDANGAPVRNTMVVLIDTNSQRYECQTDENGQYLFRNVPTGRYMIRAE